MLYVTLFLLGLFLSIVSGSIVMCENKKTILTKCFNTGFFCSFLWISFMANACASSYT